ncbi:MAG: hypothetical protein IT299_10145 [Dehalococcoidia bacterium]|nr:hypothetical protein [Dehalococcoidia bacterium]
MDVARARHALTYGALVAATRVAAAVPLALSYRIGRAAGLLAWWAWPRGRHWSVANLAHVTGDGDAARRLARASFAYFGTYLVDFLRFSSLSRRDIAAAIDFDDWPRIEEQRTGNGIVFVTLHFGNWDMAGAVLAQRMPITVIADTFENPGVDRVVLEARRRLGMTIVPAGRTGPEVLRALRRNDVLAVLADVPRAGGSARVDFFGAPIELPDGPARLALRSGAPIIVGGVWRKGPTSPRYDACAELVEFLPTGDREGDVQGLTQAMASALERLVRRAPEQWYVFRDLWRLDEARSARGVRNADVAPASEP